MTPPVTDPEFWDTIARRRIDVRNAGKTLRWLEWNGEDPEALFAVLAADAADRASRVLDVGCGEGRFTRELARGSAVVVGLDVSAVAISEARKNLLGENPTFVVGDARKMPFQDAFFDLVCARRGPITDQEVLREVARVMQPGALLIALVPGESHRIETLEIFGRGTGWPPRTPIRFAVPEMLGRNGLELLFFTESYGVGTCADIGSFAAHLQTIPLIPDFDPSEDAALLREVQRKLQTPSGIRDTEHMAVFAARRP